MEYHGIMFHELGALRAAEGCRVVDKEGCLTRGLW